MSGTLSTRLASLLETSQIADRRGTRQSSAFDVFRHGLPCLPGSTYFDYNKDHCGDIPTTGDLDSVFDFMRLPSDLGRTLVDFLTRQS